MDFNFSEFITQRKTGFVGERGGDQYAFSGDLKLLKAMRNLKPLELAVSSTVRIGKGMLTGDLLGTAVKVGPNQYPRVHNIVKSCATTLGIPAPQVFIAGKIDQINAMTLGTDKESIIVIHALTVDHLTDDELKFVIGHECGHIQNGHVVYLTTLRMLTQMATVILGPFGFFMQPAVIALQGWSRAAEITCDRAGLLCCKDVNVGQHAFLKILTGSMDLYKQLNIDVYLDQLREGREGVGRASEMMHTHPYIPKRIESLRLFAQSELFRKATGLDGGLAMTEVDRQVEEIVKVL